jgi:hypothetical protein
MTHVAASPETTPMRKILILLLVASPAFADIIDPTEEACGNASEGDACEAEGISGSCRPAECCRNDYSNVADSGAPSTVCEPCLRCEPADEPVSADGTADRVPAGDANADPGPAPDAGVPSPPSNNEDSGCEAGVGDSSAVGLLAFLAGLFLVVGLRRSR